MAIFGNDRPARFPRPKTGSGRGTEFLVSLAGLCENLHTKVEVCSCFTFQVISILK